MSILQQQIIITELYKHWILLLNDINIVRILKYGCIINLIIFSLQWYSMTTQYRSKLIWNVFSYFDAVVALGLQG